LELHNCVAPFTDSCVPFTNHGMVPKFGAEKPISWAKPEHFDCLE
jgi:hypothetical protein